MTEPSEGGVESLKSEIVRLTKVHWDATGRAVLLARIGHTLTRNGFNLRALLRGQKFAAFVRNEMQDQVLVLDSPTDALVQGAVPLGEAGKAYDPEVVFSPPAGSLGSSSRISFDKRLWVAFSHPLAEGNVRTITFEPEIVFRDVAIGDPSLEGALTIRDDLIIPIGTLEKVERDSKLQRNILEWLTANSVDIELAKARYGFHERPPESMDSVLSLLLAALDTKERERISLPLDIVDKLLKKRVGKG